jgi:hypothetical protein
VEALDVARAGIDSAVYGYWARCHVRPGGIISRAARGADVTSPAPASVQPTSATAVAEWL